jgi:glucosyl-dolichyl phosphate glucuronosyltransferase
MDISVVLCTYNRASSIGKSLESLRQMSLPPDLKWELIVVDNNSTDDTRAVVTEFARTSGLKVRYVFEPKQGLCHGRNTGVVSASGEIIAFTDDDVHVAPHWLRELALTFKEFDCIGLGGKSVPAWNGLAKPDWLVTSGPYCLSRGPILDFDLGDKAKEIRVAPWGLNMAFRKTAFERFGLFRTDLDVLGSGGLLGGDTEFGKRLLNLGEKIVYSPKAVVYHPVAQPRITKNYLLLYQHRLGRTAVREEGGWPSEAVLYFGAPRYIYRSVLMNCANWLFAFDKKKRFYYKARVYCLFGYIAEGRKMQRETVGNSNRSKYKNDVIAGEHHLRPKD